MHNISEGLSLPCVAPASDFSGKAPSECIGRTLLYIRPIVATSHGNSVKCEVVMAVSFN